MKVSAWLRGAALVVLGLAVTGCLDATTLISVKKDGSGTIIETVYVTPTFEQMMAGFAAMGGGGPNGQKPENPLDKPVDRAEYEAKAAKFGAGVTLVNVKKLKRKRDGAKGVTAKFAFTDIRQVTLNAQPPAPGGAGGMGMGGLAAGMGGGMTPSGDAQPAAALSFGFAPGDTAKLTVNLPLQDVGAAPAPAAGEEAPAAPASTNPQQAMMMRRMFAGFRMRLLLKVDGEIGASNAAYITKNRRTGRRSQVTLMDMNVGKIVENPRQFAKLTQIGKPKSIAEAMAKLKDFPELRFQQQPKLEIPFR